MVLRVECLLDIVRNLISDLGFEHLPLRLPRYRDEEKWSSLLIIDFSCRCKFKFYLAVEHRDLVVWAKEICHALVR
ncbi:hypothetical protein CUMW_167400 [Citrus unshiu]|uniref:Uncharacterized protein n=1 Tax=Citrus unshiu TaxID=55188 RepID=A0A2H5PU29_CITUN|nr:hypothetical protein CUMW_167400 [Citrus unshiu]